MAVDLHSHSQASDGSSSPEELARLFAASGVNVAALTDHDTMGGGGEFISVCGELGIKGIVGIEISSILKDGPETHVLGYGLPEDDPRWTGYLAKHWDYLRGRCEATLGLLARYGYRVDIEDVYRISRGNPAMPPHILWALAERGFIHDLSEAVNFFMEFLANGAKAWVPHETLAESAIRTINEVGGISIIAHPSRYPGIDRLEELLDAGARGFELYYPEQNGPVFERLADIARKRGCPVTGGCDFHGAFSERRIREVEVPYHVAERLFEAMGLKLEAEGESG
jgi:hypothetical protein